MCYNEYMEESIIRELKEGVSEVDLGEEFNLDGRAMQQCMKATYIRLTELEPEKHTKEKTKDTH